MNKMDIPIDKLKEHPLNNSLFQYDKRDTGDFLALKGDIKEKGIKTELHITKDFVVLCGHQRLKAAKELDMKTVPCKIIKEVDTLEKQEEYIIKDNLLRRHLSTQQRYLLFARLSELYEIGRGRKPGEKYKDLKGIKVIPSNKDSVLEKTAMEIGVGRATIARARAYTEAIKQNPDLIGKGVSEVMNYGKPEESEEEELEREWQDLLSTIKNIRYNSKYKQYAKEVYQHLKILLKE